MQHMEVMRLIDAINKTLACVCPRWSSDDELDHSQEWSTVLLEQRNVRVKEWFAVECLQILQGCVDVLRGKHAIDPFTEGILSTCRRFYVNRFSTDR